MHSNRSRQLILKMLLTYALVIGFGSWVGHLWVVLTVVLAAHLLWHLVQVHWLHDWLQEFDDSEPHRAQGIWGEALDLLWVIRRRQRTELRRLEKNLQRVQDSVESLSDGLIIITRQGELQWWNEAAQDMFQFNSEDLGQPITNLLRDPAFMDWFDRNLHHSHFEWHAIQGPQVLQFTNNRHTADNRLLLIRDTTRLRQLEQVRQDFVANASHELRTPLTVLLGYLEGFSEQHTELPARAHRAVAQMLEQTRRMANLVNDLMLLTRLDTPQPREQAITVNMAELLQCVAEDARELSAERDHKVVVEVLTDRAVLGYPNELRSAVSNLAYNAINYTPEQGQIRLVWEQDELGGALSVVDNGIGIAPEHINRVTERFYRVDPGRSSTTGGTGLGLAIVKHALAHHEARLVISSTLEQGSTFRCEFPAQRMRQLDRPHNQENTQQNEANT